MIKITKYMTFGHFKGIYTSKNLVLNTFSGSTNLWSFLENKGTWVYFFVMYGAFEWVRGAQNYSK